jgi:TetR/AcrR family transcriptional regulator, cholesterol catabolism regulator
VPRQPNNTAETICRKAAALFATQGYHATTMDDVAAAMKLNKGTLYYYFSAKADILFRICDEIVTEFTRVASDVAGAPASEAIETILRSQLGLIGERPNEIAVFLQEAHWLKEWLSRTQLRQIVEKEAAYTSVMIRLIKDGIRTGEFRDADAAVAAHSIMGVVAWASRWYRPKGDVSLEQLTDETIGFTLAALAASVPATR